MLECVIERHTLAAVHLPVESGVDVNNHSVGTTPLLISAMDCGAEASPATPRLFACRPTLRRLPFDGAGERILTLRATRPRAFPTRP